jgi:hypothetical protein
MKNLIILFTLFCVTQTMKSQDILELNNGTNLKVKIVEQSPQGIKYILWDKPADTLSINQSAISLIRRDSTNNNVVYKPVGKGFPSDTVYPIICMKKNIALWLNCEGGETNSSSFYSLSINFLYKDYLFTAENLVTSADFNFNTSYWAGSNSITYPPVLISTSTKLSSSNSILFGKTFFIDKNKQFAFDLSLGISSLKYYNYYSYYDIVYTPAQNWGILGTTPASTSTYYNDTTKITHTIGLPLAIKIHLPSFTAVGLDVGFKADFNKVSNFFAWSIGLRLGRITKRK